MARYTTLGDGKNTKILAVSDFNPARTVVTCDNDRARTTSRALCGTDTQMWSSLHPLAVALDGEPVEARRRLLGVYDTAAAGGPVDTTDELWGPPSSLVAAVGSAVAGAPVPVISAVRDELADHLDGLDGVLVPARAVTYGHKRMNCPIVIGQVLDYDAWWEYDIVGNDAGLSAQSDDDLWPAGGPLVGTGDGLYEILAELWDQEPFGNDYSAFTISEIRDEDDCGLLVRCDHLVAWARHHRPDVVDLLVERFELDA